jgi:hypothetical protein
VIRSPVDADAQIGKVTVAGDWIASSLLAGVDTIDGRHGDGNDARFVAAQKDEAGVVSSIASITIRGHVLGLATSMGLNTSGFAGEQIGSFTSNGIQVGLTPGKRNDTFAGIGLAGNAHPVGPSPATAVDDGFAVHVFEV